MLTGSATVQPVIEKNNHRLLCSTITVNGSLSVQPSPPPPVITQSVSLSTDSIATAAVAATNPNTTLLYHDSIRPITTSAIAASDENAKLG